MADSAATNGSFPSQDEAGATVAAIAQAETISAGTRSPNAIHLHHF